MRTDPLARLVLVTALAFLALLAIAAAPSTDGPANAADRRGMSVSTAGGR